MAQEFLAAVAAAVLARATWESASLATAVEEAPARETAVARDVVMAGTEVEALVVVEAAEDQQVADTATMVEEGMAEEMEL